MIYRWFLENIGYIEDPKFLIELLLFVLCVGQLGRIPCEYLAQP
jgi:hypothetical protein